MNKKEIKEVIEVIKEFKHFADLVESPDEYFQHMQGHTKELSLILNVFDVADLCDDITKLLQQQLTNGWIPVSERLPEPKEWCWVWFDYDEDGHSRGNGFCEKMYLSSNGKWMKNTLSTVKDEYMDCIRAWQPYFEPEPYKEVSDHTRKVDKEENV